MRERLCERARSCVREQEAVCERAAAVCERAAAVCAREAVCESKKL